MLSEENLKELRHNLAHLSLPAVREFYERGIPGLSPDLQSSPKSSPNADPRPGVEAVVEVALSLSAIIC